MRGLRPILPGASRGRRSGIASQLAFALVHRISDNDWRRGWHRHSQGFVLRSAQRKHHSLGSPVAVLRDRPIACEQMPGISGLRFVLRCRCGPGRLERRSQMQLCSPLDLSHTGRVPPDHIAIEFVFGFHRLSANVNTTSISAKHSERF
jgi:hypothetical protein